MSGWLLTLLALFGSGAFVVTALGYLFPEVVLKNRIAATFYLFSAAGALAQAWKWGSR